MKVYFDFRDWWVGVYFDEYYFYICPFPCIVIRIRRKYRKEDIATCKFIDAAFNLKTRKEIKDAKNLMEAILHYSKFDNVGNIKEHQCK